MTGLPVYRWRMAPRGLATRRQLRAQGLRPNGQDIQGRIIWRRGERFADLYSVEKAAPKREATPAQLVAIRAALDARMKCPSCEEVKDYFIQKSLGECSSCHEGAVEANYDSPEVNYDFEQEWEIGA